MYASCHSLSHTPTLLFLHDMAVLISMTSQSPPQSPVSSLLNVSSPRLGRRAGLAHILDPTNGSRRPADTRRNAMPHIWFELDASIGGRIARRLRNEQPSDEEEVKESEIERTARAQREEVSSEQVSRSGETCHWIRSSIPKWAILIFMSTTDCSASWMLEIKKNLM